MMCKTWVKYSAPANTITFVHLGITNKASAPLFFVHNENATYHKVKNNQKTKIMVKLRT